MPEEGGGKKIGNGLFLNLPYKSPTYNTKDMGDDVFSLTKFSECHWYTPSSQIKRRGLRGPTYYSLVFMSVVYSHERKQRRDHFLIRNHAYLTCENRSCSLVESTRSWLFPMNSEAGGPLLRVFTTDFFSLLQG